MARLPAPSTALLRFLPVALALAAGAAGRPAPLAAQQEDDVEGRVISVTGEGKVTAAPDLARFQVGVVTETAGARAASDQNAIKMASVVEALGKLGMASDKVRTVQLTLQPVYDYNEGRQVLRGFQARNVVEATTAQLGELGEMLDAVIKVGGNTVEGIQFELADPGVAQTRAMTEALADARRKAEALAGAAGVGLGDVQQISAGYGAPPIPLPQPRMAVMDARAEAAAPPVSPGELTVNASVQVAYRIR